MAIEITIKDNGEHRTRWAHPDLKGQWSSASNLGKDHQEHSSEAAARLAMAGWLRSQAAKLEEVPPPPKVQPAEPEPVLSAAGLEDLL